MKWELDIADDMTRNSVKGLVKSIKLDIPVGMYYVTMEGYVDRAVAENPGKFVGLWSCIRNEYVIIRKG